MFLYHTIACACPYLFLSFFCTCPTISAQCGLLLHNVVDVAFYYMLNDVARPWRAVWNTCSDGLYGGSWVVFAGDVDDASTSACICVKYVCVFHKSCHFTLFFVFILPFVVACCIGCKMRGGCNDI